MTTEQEARKKDDHAAATEAATSSPGFRVSLDAWAVSLALIVSLLVWTGVIKHIPW
jgi:hypothetical protein